MPELPGPEEDEPCTWMPITAHTRLMMSSSMAETLATASGRGRPSSSCDTVVEVSPLAECR